MDIEKKSVLKRVFSLVLFILIANLLAMKFFWYSSIWYFDMIMHFLGGFWLAMILVYVFLYHLKMDRNNYFKLAIYIILSVVVIGFLWEIFEVVVSHLTQASDFNTLDTASDLFFDLTGGLVGVIFFLTKMDKPKIK